MVNYRIFELLKIIYFRNCEFRKMVNWLIFGGISKSDNLLFSGILKFENLLKKIINEREFFRKIKISKRLLKLLEIVITKILKFEFLNSNFDLFIGYCENDLRFLYLFLNFSTRFLFLKTQINLNKRIQLYLN